MFADVDVAEYWVADDDDGANAGGVCLVWFGLVLFGSFVGKVCSPYLSVSVISMYNQNTLQCNNNNKKQEKNVEKDVFSFLLFAYFFWTRFLASLINDTCKYIRFNLTFSTI